MSSSASLGASRCGRVMTVLSKHDYRCARVSASGQQRGSRRNENGLVADVIALSTWYGTPHFMCEVGGAGKRLAVTFAALREALPAGFAPLVVRFVGRKSFWYTSPRDRFTSFAAALAAVSEP